VIARHHLEDPGRPELGQLLIQGHPGQEVVDTVMDRQ
jgi:hypothetical protein